MREATDKSGHLWDVFKIVAISFNAARCLKIHFCKVFVGEILLNFVTELIYNFFSLARGVRPVIRIDIIVKSKVRK